MNISGVEPISFVDYPHGIAYTIFTQGCSVRCPYCHNKQLIPFTEGTIDLDTISVDIEKRKNDIDIIIISGGEPFAQRELLPDIIKLKARHGMPIGIHTSGTNIINKELFNYIDWVGLDIKHEFTKYGELMGIKGAASAFIGMNVLTVLGVLNEQMRDSKGNRKYETRMTWYPPIHNEKNLENICNALAGKTDELIIQQCREGDKRHPLPNLSDIHTAIPVRFRT